MEKYHVSESALISRINKRITAFEQKILKKCSSSSKRHSDLGDYYIINFYKHVVDGHIDLEQYGRKIGVLKEWEILAV